MYVSDGNATCTEDGTMSRNCITCKEKDALVILDEGSKLEHSFTNYEKDENGLFVAECNYGCGATSIYSKLELDLNNIYNMYIDDSEEKSICYNIPQKQTAGKLIEMFENEEYVTIVSAEGVELTENDIVGSGCVIKLVVNGEIVDEAIAIVTGDVDGDGLVNTKDVILLRRSVASNNVESI
jgi:hypothetical protein